MLYYAYVKGNGSQRQDKRPIGSEMRAQMFYMSNAKLTDENPNNAIFHVMATHQRNDKMIWETLIDLTNNNVEKSKTIIRSLSSENNCLMIYHTQKGVLVKISDFTELKSQLLDYHCHPNTIRGLDKLEDGDGLWITFNQDTADDLVAQNSNVEWDIKEVN